MELDRSCSSLPLDTRSRLTEAALRIDGPFSPGSRRVAVLAEDVIDENGAASGGRTQCLRMD